jgi:hypothetical protein
MMVAGIITLSNIARGKRAAERARVDLAPGHRSDHHLAARLATLA